ncbi:MAG TPA: DUF5686 family protein [Bacteroidales bacterium]
MKSCILVFLLALIFPVLISGQTRVNGRVADAQTFEPVAFADILFKGTTIGVKTDFDGSYSLSGNTLSDSIVISFLGYEIQTIGIKHDTVQTINIQLHPALYAIQEVRITPGENPAHLILRKFWKNRDLNSIGSLSSYQYENYSRSIVFLRKFNNKPDSLRSVKFLSKEFDKYSIKTGDQNLPALPSYITESLSDNYFLRSPKREYTYIKATNSNGMAFENTDMVAQLVSKQENFYFPDNTIPLINKSFISPLSRFGLLYYKYYLTDSLLIDNKYFCYEISFKPKREEDPVFHGTIWINDTTYALKRIVATVTEKAELNFIKRLKIQQDYEPFGSGAWFPVRTRFMADAANIFLVNYSQKSDIIVNQPLDPGFYGSELKISLSSHDHDRTYWESTRKNSLDRIDSLAFLRVDSLKKNNKIRISAKLVEASIKGYYNTGKFEVGPYLLIYNHNSIEGNRFRLGGRTNVAFSTRWIIEGYLAYATRDNRLKGSLQTEYFLNKEHWSKIGVQFRDDIENVGSLDEFYSPGTFLTFATSFGGSDKMNKTQIFRTWLESDLLKGMTGKLVFTRKTFEPLSSGYYFAWYTDPARTIESINYITSEIGLILRYQPKATYVLDGVRRFPVNFNKYPVFSFEYYRGLPGFMKGDFQYNKIVADISHNFNFGGLGSIEYDFGFTKVFGQLPYPLLITLAGNQSIFRTSRTYNLMNYGEFVLDEALEMNMTYHMNGLIMNKLPLLKKLRLRTVVSARAAFGSFNDKLNGFYDPVINRDAILPDSIRGNSLTRFNSLTYNRPYIELSYGIENIFSFLRIDLIHRLTWLENPDLHRFGVKISGVFRF